MNFVTLMTITVGLLAMSPSVKAESLFDQLGGMEGIQKFVDRTVDLSASNPEIGHFFERSILSRVKDKLAEQICELSGGPCKYTGALMDRLHKPMGITTKDFNVLVEDLQHAMDEAEIPNRAQNKLIAILAPMHRDIVED
ncbi:MAG: group 1 truncated hemoglobin [Kordiimonadaceae bacterium]|nr:group 1 truncated hemoglobin [Kordiimonadaceae bacterium]MBO6568628.1 group 1 truncated hemoglobin [Kordiimonadaceae bacterium]MBO6965396.1 group 1 truncated hemoglobin [Kordiimonadaceae bacterium]